MPVSRMGVDIVSRLLSGPLIRELLSGISSSEEITEIQLWTSVACTPIFDIYRADDRRSTALRRDEAGGGQRHRGSSVTLVVYCDEQRRDDVGVSIRQGDHHPRLFSSASRETVPVPTRIDSVEHLSHVLQPDLDSSLCLVRDRDGSYLPRWRPHRTITEERFRRASPMEGSESGQRLSSSDGIFRRRGWGDIVPDAQA